LIEPNAEFRRRHPRGDELLLVLEVADTTVRYDATTKRDLYARAGVPEYWVLDIPGRRIIAHRKLTAGRFEEIIAFSDGEIVAPAGRPDLTLAVAECLP
jgi:Uma2 family endonuclease